MYALWVNLLNIPLFYRVKEVENTEFIKFPLIISTIKCILNFNACHLSSFFYYSTFNTTLKTCFIFRMYQHLFRYDGSKKYSICIKIGGYIYEVYKMYIRFYGSICWFARFPTTLYNLKIESIKYFLIYQIKNYTFQKFIFIRNNSNWFFVIKIVQILDKMPWIWNLLFIWVFFKKDKFSS